MTAQQDTELEAFLKKLKRLSERARLDKALKMLKADRFQLFSDLGDEEVCGVIKSQTNPELVYACRLAADGGFSCCTQRLYACGGLRGRVCKHLLVLLIGLVHSGELETGTVVDWIKSSRRQKPKLDKDRQGEILLRYKGAEAGELDWRPTETVPEDFYTF
jgi:hypothetical protein